MVNRDEFGFIERIKVLFGAVGNANIEGIGDDCAVIPLDGDSSLVITTDLLTEGVHFLREAISARELGRKSLTVNLSDVAAMGARPIASLLSIALPKECNGEWADDFMDGYRALSAEHDVALIGGDTTSSLSGITINVVAIGRAANAHIKRRSGARVGDRIFVGGTLGESAAGLRDVLKGEFGTPLAHIHHNPSAQIDEGAWLGQQTSVHAMIDLSDGLASDLMHILRASGCDARIDLDRIPTNVDIEFAVMGGEDYKLLFTVSESEAELLKSAYESHFGVPVYEVGLIVAPDGAAREIAWLENGATVDRQWKGFVHF